MDILHTVESYYPSIGGMQEVVRRISEALVERGHSVTVATSSELARNFKMLSGVCIEEFSISGNAVRGISGSSDEIHRYRRLLRSDRFDVVCNFAAQQWASDLAFEELDHISAAKCLVPTGFSALRDSNYADYFQRMPKIMAKYDANVFLSYRYQDIAFARENGVDRCVVIPNGAAQAEFGRKPNFALREKLGIPEDVFLMLLVGSHTGEKGHREAIEIFRRANLKNAALLIVGNSFGGGCAAECRKQCRVARVRWERWRHKKRLVVRGLTREETVAAYFAADLFLFPSNIECSPIVLFESMAAGTPFLSSDVGNSVEIVEWGGGGCIMDTEKDACGRSHVDIDSAVRALEELYRDRDLREELGRKGRASWERTFSWEQIAARYEELYSRLKENRGLSGLEALAGFKGC